MGNDLIQPSNVIDDGRECLIYIPVVCTEDYSDDEDG